MDIKYNVEFKRKYPNLVHQTIIQKKINKKKMEKRNEKEEKIKKC